MVAVGPAFILAAVDKAVNRARVRAALVAQDQGRLAGEAGVLHLAGELLHGLGQRRLAGAGISEQAEDRLDAAVLRVLMPVAGWRRARRCCWSLNSIY
jgi:hypothetical protein